MTLLFLFSVQAWAVGNSSLEIATRCSSAQNESTPLYSSDFKWGYNLPELLVKFTEIYQSPKRLPQKAYWSPEEKKIKLPSRDFWGGEIDIHPRFIQTVARHIEQAFSMNVIDGVFFPDMGHSHLLIHQDLYDQKYANFPVSEFKIFYEKLFEDPALRILYHTAEQLQMLDENNAVLPDARIKTRHQT